MDSLIDLAADILNSLVSGVSGAAFLRALAYFGIGVLLPLGVAGLVLYFLVSLPFVRRERARMLLDLLELGLSSGLRAEETIRQVAACRDPVLGRSMRWLVAGGRFSEAMHMVPGYLPANVTSMLRAADEAGQLPRMIPACRRALEDQVSRSRSVMHALPLVFYVTVPVLVVVLAILSVYVLPKLRDVAWDMGVVMPPLSVWVFDHTLLLIMLALLAYLLMGCFLLAHFAGGRTRSVLRMVLGPVFDWLLLRLPWCRLRCQRDFATTLATMLDAGFPEAQALHIAAEATGNHIMIKRAGRVREALQSGVALPEALGHLDKDAELSWRLRNAMKGGRTFADSLAGWSEVVDARAFQQEQVSAQILTTSVVLINGLVVGLTYAAVFMILIQIIEVGLSW